MFSKQNAEKLRIEGTVQNSSDGSVIINACGQSENIEDLIDALYQGPPQSTVEQIIEEPIIKGRNFRGVFRIIGSN